MYFLIWGLLDPRLPRLVKNNVAGWGLKIGNFLGRKISISGTDAQIMGITFLVSKFTIFWSNLSFLASCILFLASGLIDRAEEINVRLASPTQDNPIGQPALLQLFALEPSTSGCDLGLCGPVLTTGVYILGSAILISTIFGLTIYIASIIRQRQMRKHASSSTYKLHQMFLRTLSIQFSIFITFLILPIIIL